MAAAYRSHTTVTVANSATAVLNKPAGLEVGDVLVAHLCADSQLFNTAAGWTLQAQPYIPGGISQTILTKVADANDVAATTFTFTLPSASDRQGALVAVSGNFEIDAKNSGTSENSSSTTKTFTGVTPEDADSLYMILLFNFGVAGAPGTVSTASNYAMVTSNPSWTEAYDFGNDSFCTAMAYASRAAVTATGNFSFDLTDQGAGSDTVATILVFDNRSDKEETPDSFQVNAHVLDLRFPIQLTASVEEPTQTTTQPTWVETSKTATSWVETSK